MGLFRRRTRADDDASPATAPGGEAPDPGGLRELIPALTAQLETAHDDAEHIDLLNRIGTAHKRLGDAASAITAFEASMAVREQYGIAYTSLLALYNEQLRDRARAADEAGIQRWTAKLDELMALSKRVMRSNY